MIALPANIIIIAALLLVILFVLLGRAPGCLLIWVLPELVMDLVCARDIFLLRAVVNPDRFAVDDDVIGVSYGDGEIEDALAISIAMNGCDINRGAIAVLQDGASGFKRCRFDEISGRAFEEGVSGRGDNLIDVAVVVCVDVEGDEVLHPTALNYVLNRSAFGSACRRVGCEDLIAGADVVDRTGCAVCHQYQSVGRE